MRKFLAVFIAALLFVTPALAAGLQLSLQDAVIHHRVFLTDQTENFTQYFVTFFGSRSRKLMQLNIEVLLNKSMGYTAEAALELDPDTIIPGFSGIACGSYAVAESDEVVHCILRFIDLNNTENLKQLVAAGILTAEDGGAAAMNADTLADSIKSVGLEIQEEEYSQLGLDLRYAYDKRPSAAEPRATEAPAPTEAPASGAAPAVFETVLTPVFDHTAEEWMASSLDRASLAVCLALDYVTAVPETGRPFSPDLLTSKSYVGRNGNVMMLLILSEDGTQGLGIYYDTTARQAASSLIDFPAGGGASQAEAAMDRACQNGWQENNTDDIYTIYEALIGTVGQE